MALGDVVLYDIAAKKLAEGAYGNLNRTNIPMIVTLINNDQKAAATDTEWVYTRVANYGDVKKSLTTSLTSDGETTIWTAQPVKFRVPNPVGGATWDVYQAIIHESTTYLEDSEIFGFVDLTPDNGVTPWDLSASPITITWNATSGILKGVRVYK